ncbi:MAG TPA: class I SAM-dependent methyltransferase, partial [Thermoanaerobaculia bacterium]|nr:class I SAM-dependent methyltransferase [Thermoanaerobaculia bacterium]
MSRSDRCDPELWAGAVEGPDGSTTHPTFRRGLELAGRRALSSAETGELWLDLGCGTGVLTRSLARARLRVIAADVDPAMLRFALRASPAAVRPVAADAARLPIADGVCDGVAAVSLVGHFPDPSPLLGECARVLRPGGRLVVTATNRAS